MENEKIKYVEIIQKHFRKYLKRRETSNNDDKNNKHKCNSIDLAHNAGNTIVKQSNDAIG